MFLDEEFLKILDILEYWHQFNKGRVSLIVYDITGKARTKFRT
jgi:hypothetical protein